MVNTFSELNRGMEKTGTFTMTRKSLFQLVAAANTTLADVILRLGLLERSGFSILNLSRRVTLVFMSFIFPCLMGLFFWMYVNYALR